MKDANVTGIVGEHFGSLQHKSMTIKHVENGFIVKYRMPAEKPDEWNKTTEHTKVFLDPQRLLAFTAGYFGGVVEHD